MIRFSCSRSRRRAWVVASGLCLFGLALWAPGLTQKGEATVLTGEFQWVHDPSRVVACDGRYYVFYTGDNIRVRSSSDLIHWENEPAVLKEVPQWMRQLVPKAKGNHVWAPDVMMVNGEYWLFYSYSTFGSQTSAIGLMTSPTLNPKSPNFKWTDRGVVVATNGTQEANAIDPAPIFDGKGELWLSYGSWNRGGIQLVKLDKTTGKPIGKSTSIASGQATGPEAPYLYFRGGYYYQFENEGLCCKGMNSTYRVMMGRSKNIEGPYLDKAGKDLAKGGGEVFLDSEGDTIGPGHIGILSENGLDTVTFHFYNGRANGVPTLGIRSLVWDAQGWPVAAPDLPGGRYAIVSKASGLALGVRDASSADGAALDQFDFLGGTMQRWNVIPLGDGYYSIASLGTGKYTDLFECGTKDGTKIGQQPWLNNDCQRWRIEAVGDGAYRVISKGGKTALSVPGSTKTPRAQMQGDAWTGAEGQKWIFRPSP